MADKGSLTRAQAVEQVLARLDGPIGVDELCRQVLTIRPSKAKNALSSTRTFLRTEQAGETLVFVDDQTVLPMPIAMRGVRFRVPLSRREAKQGALIVRPAFDVFLRSGLEPSQVQLKDVQNRALPVRLVTFRERVDTPFGNQMVEQTAYELGDWFRARRIKRDDSILVTIEDWTNGCFRLEHEPAKRARQGEIEAQDRELAGVLFDMLERSDREQLYALRAVLSAYGRLSAPRGYPGNHWTDVVESDPRMRYDGWRIIYSDVRSPLEAMFMEDVPLPEAVFSPDQGRQVYRFKAVLVHRRGLWRVIEIQGLQTLADFDSVLRDAFNHDFSDHLGGFWKRVPRGRTRRFREIDLGYVDPFGGGDAAGLRIAGLGLEVGDELKYVYDFGDWIEHHITLDAILEPKKSEYPRIVDQNVPQYEDCQSCQAQGRKSRATWICLECSDEEGRAVLVCDDCLGRAHEDHYAEEILY